MKLATKLLITIGHKIWILLYLNLGMDLYYIYIGKSTSLFIVWSHPWMLSHTKGSITDKF